MSDAKKRIVRFFSTGYSFILFCASFFSGISSKRKSAFWWIHGILLARFHHQRSAVLPSMRFERGERSKFDSSCASKKTCKSCQSESEEAEGEGPFCATASLFFTPVPRGSSVAPILAPIGRVSQSYIIATFTFLHFTNEHACIRA